VPEFNFLTVDRSEVRFSAGAKILVLKFSWWI
jgi:hypothetical protein